MQNESRKKRKAGTQKSARGGKKGMMTIIGDGDDDDRDNVGREEGWLLLVFPHSFRIRVKEWEST